MKRLILVAVLALTSFVVGYITDPAKAYYGQSPGYGYFTGAGYDLSGWEVLNVSCSTGGEYGPYNYYNGEDWCNAMPRDLNTAGELIAFIEGRLANGVPNGSYGFGSGTYGDTRARTGAASIVHTMIGTPSGSRSRPPTAAQMTEWRNLVNQYSAAGRIQWGVNAGFSVNSLYQGTDNSPSPNDVTFYSEWRTGPTIVFTAPNGTVYGIRKACGNPMGGTSLPDLENFTMTGRTTVNDTTVLPGQTITFQHYVRNNGPTATSTSIWWVAERTSPAPTATVGGAANSGTYAAGQEKNVFNHNVTIPANAIPNTQYCERVGWDPVNSAGARDGRGTPACATVQYDFSLTPSVNAVVSSAGAPIAGNIAEPGDTVTFTYAVNNTGLTISQPVTCTYRQATYAGYSTTAPVTLFTPVGANCPPVRTFPGNNTNTTTATEINIPLNTVNQSICKSFTISPVSHTGSPASRTAQACVHVAAKPYTRVYGGDISAGNGLADSSGACTSNANGAVVGWNKRAGGSYAGAGALYAVYAMAAITDFASALGSTAGANAQPPGGLSFANTATNFANGLFGGSLGAVPCIADHYATLPTGATNVTSPVNVSNLTTGSYVGAGTITLAGGGNINPNNRAVLYVDGNVYINNNITFPGTWDVGTAPMFTLIVRGNIYIDNDVIRLDGVYIAQRNGASGGEIHTCATSAAALPLSGNLYTTCNPANQPLVVNGAFMAHQVRLLRTRGSLIQSNAAETSATSQGGEIFNFNPVLWINQPEVNDATTPDYDAIISLPPIL